MSWICCCWYHKGTNFQANHNHNLAQTLQMLVVADTTKVRIFKQITTHNLAQTLQMLLLLIPQRYEFSSKSQRNAQGQSNNNVVADTTKVRIFKQITTNNINASTRNSCCWYHKGTNFQANHNNLTEECSVKVLLLIPQRYEFSSKSQPLEVGFTAHYSCCWYHKGTNFQANHNSSARGRINNWLLLIPQRYEFSSKSQQHSVDCQFWKSCCWYHKGTNFQANHNNFRTLQWSV